VAVYDQTYRGYKGPSTPARFRFLILPRYAFQQVFRSRIFAGFFAACFLLPVGAALLIYLHHNLAALQSLRMSASQLITINARFFMGLMSYQSFFLGFAVVLVSGPGLVCTDLANNALPLYLSRPFSRSEYVLGKISVLVILLSAITWIPGLLLFFFQGYLAGWSWLADNARVGVAIVVGSWVWIAAISLLALALSAHVRRRMVAQAALLGVIFGGTAMGQAVNVIFETRWGQMLNLPEVMRSVWSALYGVDFFTTLPPVAGWVSLAALTLGCLGLLTRKLRAYEVAR
jgi:ABC-2 type transport system permease protein